MGMFDYIKCKCPLPIGGYKEREFQTKDTPAQYLDNYEIREDGTLWHEEYDIEDHSDPNAEGLMRFSGCMTKANLRWVQKIFTGEICFHDFPTGDYRDGGWVEFSAYFVDGKLREINTVESTAPTKSKAIQSE